MRTRLAAVLTALALVFPLTATAAEPVASKPTITKTFAVADLVVPIPDFGDDPGPVNVRQQSAVTDGADNLMKLVTCLIRPNSWAAMGGQGTVEFFSTGHVLVVKNSAEVVKEVADLLQAMRRLRDVSVVTEVRLVTVPAGFCKRVGVNRDGASLTERELNLFLEAAQAHREANVMQFPKVTTFDGQTATIRAGEQRLFATSAEVVKMKGQSVLVPKHKPVDLGDTLTLCGRISVDRKFVNLQTKLSRTSVVGEVELVPITMKVTPIFEGGSQGRPIPFTQFLEAPELCTQSAAHTAVVPDGGTVVIGSWNETIRSAPAPVLTKIPYVNRLFKNPGEVKECEVLVLATTRIILAGEKTEKK